VSRRLLAAAFGLAVAFCGRAPRGGPPPKAEAASGGAGALLPAPRFVPPPDGVLTDEQVDRFLRVRRAAKGRTDTGAARALGIPPDEIAWTRARVIEALVALDERRVRESSAEVYVRAVAALRAARGGARDPARVRALEEQIAALERERLSLRREDTPSPALAGNMRRVAPRRTELEAVAP
jgi:hypothetical protein